LHSGAGRIFVCLLDPEPQAINPALPELMLRALDGMEWSTQTVVAGCGGGKAIGKVLPSLIEESRSLVLDADALNQLALHPEWTQGLIQRNAGTTAMTPHPLEAARLLGITVTEVQANRLHAAQLLAERYQCTVALKGSGTVMASPGEVPCINPTGNARLASAGTGDVLAGLVGAYMAQGLNARHAVHAAVYRHGLAADRWQGPVLRASELSQRL
jgi:ADP-dependent NAD(P)H-hydrate dehydratase / NAD(P)H-hydrate epimerase